MDMLLSLSEWFTSLMTFFTKFRKLYDRCASISSIEKSYYVQALKEPMNFLQIN